jgi:hypothetical protein
MQNIVDAVYNENSDRQKLLNYLTNTFDHYVNSTKKLSDTNDVPLNNEYGWRKQQEAAEIRLRHNKSVSLNDKNESDYEEEMDVDDFNQIDMNQTKGQRFGAKFKRMLKVLCITKGKRNGNYLLVLFVCCRILYSINSISQLFILNHFLGNDFLLLGFEVMSKVWYGDDWSQLKR